MLKALVRQRASFHGTDAATQVPLRGGHGVDRVGVRNRERKRGEREKRERERERQTSDYESFALHAPPFTRL